MFCKAAFENLKKIILSLTPREVDDEMVVDGRRFLESPLLL